MACFDLYADVDKEKKQNECSITLTNRYLRLFPYPGIVSKKKGFFQSKLSSHSYDVMCPDLCTQQVYLLHLRWLLASWERRGQRNTPLHERRFKRDSQQRLCRGVRRPTFHAQRRVSRPDSSTIQNAWRIRHRKVSVVVYFGCAPLITLFPPHTSYTQAQTYWRKNAPFRGVPFKAGLSAAQISRVLKVFGQNGANCESAVTNFLICPLR